MLSDSVGQNVSTIKAASEPAAEPEHERDDGADRDAGLAPRVTALAYPARYPEQQHSRQRRQNRASRARRYLAIAVCVTGVLKLIV